MASLHRPRNLSRESARSSATCARTSSFCKEGNEKKKTQSRWYSARGQAHKTRKRWVLAQSSPQPPWGWRRGAEAGEGGQLKFRGFWG